MQHVDLGPTSREVTDHVPMRVAASEHVCAAVQKQQHLALDVAFLGLSHSASSNPRLPVFSIAYATTPTGI